jgi:hypothetical protein
MGLRIGTWIALAFVAASSSPPAFAQAGQWQVDLAPAQCRLSRNIAGAQPSAISIQTAPGSDDYQLTLAGPGLRGIVSGEFDPAELIFADASKIAVTTRAARLDGELSTAVQMRGIGPELLDRLAGASTIALRRRNRESSPIALTNPAKAVAALRQCNADQLIEWGADPAQFQPRGAMPVALIRRDDWLTKSQLIGLTAGRSEIHVLLKVGVAADGTVDACDAISADANAKLTKSACTPVKGRKLFVPARAPDGTAVRSVATFSIELISRPNL